MTASKGVKNLQPDTIKSIAIAWILTLPVTMILAGGFYYILQLLLK
jgi:PiT family inorganic phosphate transporter